eukprot:10877459-Alexandrium_andersonii.AAC.1
MLVCSCMRVSLGATLIVQCACMSIKPCACIVVPKCRRAFFLFGTAVSSRHTAPSAILPH